MKTTIPNDALLALSPDDVLSVYSGKQGCCCGCNGKHAYNSKHVAIAAQRRNYAIKPDEIDDDKVAEILAKLKAHADDVEKTVGPRLSPHYSLDLGNRTYVVYLAADPTAQ